MPDKIDLRKQYHDLYSPSKKEFSFIEVPPLQYLMINGSGDPNNSQRYMDAIQTLYSLSYTLKFSLKKAQGIDYSVMGLEGLWWMPNMNEWSESNKSRWLWTAMMLQPDFITPELFEEARRPAQAKGKAPLAGETRLETLTEGPSCQIMYFGAYVDEAPTIAAMHKFIADHGYERNLKHHEIYLSDARKVAPEKNRTILRQPVVKG
jgi:hypothetical protein